MNRKKAVAVIAGILCVIIIAFFVAYMKTLGDPNALWKIVHNNCVPSQTTVGKPGKCQFVDLGSRYAVLKDLRGATRFLLLPTDPVSGIESPQLLQADVPNYWRAAWQARSFAEARAGRPIPRDWVGLSINSEHHRTQNQLHIHIDCIQPELHAALAALADRSDGWSATPILLAGHEFFITKLASTNLENIDPFKLLANRLPDPGTQMGANNLSIVGMESSAGAGFYLLDSPVGPRGATSDDVLDRRCKFLHEGTGG